jgi:hypothetical protein
VLKLTLCICASSNLCPAIMQDFRYTASAHAEHQHGIPTLNRLLAHLEYFVEARIYLPLLLSGYSIKVAPEGVSSTADST